jgi:hypothetical protein
MDLLNSYFFSDPRYNNQYFVFKVSATLEVMPYNCI